MEIATDAVQILGFAMYVWTIPIGVVQTYIALSV
jgi:hypothetical protein